MMDSQVIAGQIHKSYDAENISSVSTSWYGYSPDIDNYIYNASGKLISLIETYDDWLSGAEIDYDTNFADYYYYDSDRLTKFQNNYYNYEYEDPDEIPSISTSEYNYEYDDAGNIVAKKYFEYYSQDSSSLEYEYSGGHLTMIRTNYQDDGVWQPTDTIELEYSGNLLTKVTFSNSENPSVRPYNKYSYNADGLIDSISKYRTWYDGLKLISFEKFEYNENRQLEFYTFYPSLLNTEVSYSIDYDYDQNSRLIEMYEYENDYDYDYGSYAAFTWNDDGTVHTREVGANWSTEYPYESWNGGSGRTEYYVTQYYYEKIVADPAGSVENGFYIHVYPSPANSNINILFVNAEGDIDVEIRDVLGRLVYNAADLSAEMKQLSIDVSTFEPGVYFVTVDSNGNTSTQSIVVK